MQTLDAIRQDRLALSVAQAIAVANGAAAAAGKDPGQCLVTVSEETAPPIGAGASITARESTGMVEAAI